MKDLPKTRVSSNNRLKISDKKKIKNSRLGMENKTKETQDLKGKNWTWTMQAGRNKLKQIWKKHSDSNCWKFARLELGTLQD